MGSRNSARSMPLKCLLAHLTSALWVTLTKIDNAERVYAAALGGPWRVSRGGDCSHWRGGRRGGGGPGESFPTKNSPARSLRNSACTLFPVWSVSSAAVSCLTLQGGNAPADIARSPAVWRLLTPSRRQPRFITHAGSSSIAHAGNQQGAPAPLAGPARDTRLAGARAEAEEALRALSRAQEAARAAAERLTSSIAADASARVSGVAPAPPPEVSEERQRGRRLRRQRRRSGGGVWSGARSARQPAQSTCVVCMVAPSEMLCFPCGHIASCERCGVREFNLRQRCPICRAETLCVLKARQAGREPSPAPSSAAGSSDESAGEADELLSNGDWGRRG